jgi:hypothetical protein
MYEYHQPGLRTTVRGGMKLQYRTDLGPPLRLTQFSSQLKENVLRQVVVSGRVIYANTILAKCTLTSCKAQTSVLLHSSLNTWYAHHECEHERATFA